MLQYVLMDLEWNNTYAKKTSAFINEIIEIGAVKLDSNRNQVDTFDCIIRSTIGKKLRGSVKKLTNLTNEDISTGLPFTKVFSLFRKWIGSEETVIVTWGDGDIRVLLENYSYLNGLTTIPFLKYYCDLQKYYQKKENRDPGRQAGLSAAALSLGIDPENYPHHRALGDSLLTADIFDILYNETDFRSEIIECNREFYERLLYKAKIIKNIDSPLVDKSKLLHNCEKCSVPCELVGKWKFSCSFFRAEFHCPDCDENFIVKVRFKKYYDYVDCKKTVTPAENTEEEDEESEK